MSDASMTSEVSVRVELLLAPVAADMIAHDSLGELSVTATTLLVASRATACTCSCHAVELLVVPFTPQNLIVIFFQFILQTVSTL
jgi:hypothetical protein